MLLCLYKFTQGQKLVLFIHVHPNLTKLLTGSETPFIGSFVYFFVCSSPCDLQSIALLIHVDELRSVKHGPSLTKSALCYN